MNESGKYQKVSVKTIGAILRHKINPSGDGIDNSFQLNSSGTLLNSSRDESMSSQSVTTKRTKVKVRQRPSQGTTSQVSTSNNIAQSEMPFDNQLPTQPQSMNTVEEAISSPMNAE